MSFDADALIVGAGVAGLTLALVLARQGRQVVLAERASALSEVGAGIQISPNAAHVLLALGLGPELARKGVAIEALRVFDARLNQPIATLPLGASAASRYGAPYWNFHRADLQSVLLDAVRAEPNIALKLDCPLGEAQETEDGVAARLGMEDKPVRVPVLIGADGVRSEVRTRLLGGAPARYSGKIAFRATTPAESLPDGQRDQLLGETNLWMGAGRHLVHYPVRSARELNLVAILAADWREEGWDHPASPVDVLSCYQDWPRQVRHLLGLPKTWRKWALCAVDPSGPWARGRIALMGDAAHAMLPTAAQGGAMAIEDAAVLGSLLFGHGDIPQALKRYEAMRGARVRRVIDTANRNVEVYGFSGLKAFARNAAIGLFGEVGLRSRMDWIYGWKPPELAAETSLPRSA
ncbi:3-hydroxybenzoate 6-hydroxylase [Hartmannibacter diazotrophicus]|uniref:3-hydroxybenzoate 6-hydroxylase n=1 Tax=Hartmannibacter diazotrophicus TaxID=1482074 RepID=A0A2C9D5X2_9HYPH|nr:FAD-dependent monooxygenase [Hartmannibacter diazotrophicus]SON55590.1 3-hydroxybenzoate 6-hydroxylase [Hartmannibacter diazotrophicus]